jgi:hypothetical protein
VVPYKKRLRLQPSWSVSSLAFLSKRVMLEVVLSQGQLWPDLHG